MAESILVRRVGGGAVTCEVGGVARIGRCELRARPDGTLAVRGEDVLINGARVDREAVARPGDRITIGGESLEVLAPGPAAPRPVGARHAQALVLSRQAAAEPTLPPAD